MCEFHRLIPPACRERQRQENHKTVIYVHISLSQATAFQTPPRPKQKCFVTSASLDNFCERGYHGFFFLLTFCSAFLRLVALRWGRRKRWPSQRNAAAAAAAAWQDSKGTLWGLKVPKASWVISHYGAVTEGSAVNTEIIWAMVNDSAVQAFGMIKDRSSCTRHLSGP